jgi:hypothetical protein
MKNRKIPVQLKNKFKKFLMTKHDIKHFMYNCHVQKMVQIWGWNEWDWVLIALLE